MTVLCLVRHNAFSQNYEGLPEEPLVVSLEHRLVCRMKLPLPLRRLQKNDKIR